MNLPVPERKPGARVTPRMYDDLVRAVNGELWPELRDLRAQANRDDFPDDAFNPSDYQ